MREREGEIQFTEEEGERFTGGDYDSVETEQGERWIQRPSDPIENLPPSHLPPSPQELLG